MCLLVDSRSGLFDAALNSVVLIAIECWRAGRGGGVVEESPEGVLDWAGGFYHFMRADAAGYVDTPQITIGGHLVHSSSVSALEHENDAGYYVHEKS